MNKFGRRLQATGIYDVVTKLEDKTGLRQSLHTQSCRDMIATNLLAICAAIVFITDEIGNANLITTRICTQIPTRI